MRKMTKKEQFGLLERFTANSKFTEEDALELGRKINAGMARRIEEELKKK